MHECEFCGEVKCFKRACIEALLAISDYYDAEAKVRTAQSDRDAAVGRARVKIHDARPDGAVTIERWQERFQP